ncbi:hypothetical protein [Nostoc sp.]|uniref:hypothetical protein n=1 Tax=Nostoc sp. TaxID=1180 RepID=UPI002FF6F3EC
MKDWVLNPPTPVQNIFLPTQVLVETPVCDGFEVLRVVSGLTQTPKNGIISLRDG